MTQLSTLNSHESDAERARLKLEQDLEELRSPETFAGFKKTLTTSNNAVGKNSFSSNQ